MILSSCDKYVKGSGGYTVKFLKVIYTSYKYRFAKERVADQGTCKWNKSYFPTRCKQQLNLQMRRRDVPARQQRGEFG